MTMSSGPSDAHPLPSLQELSRIMDVASALRRERDSALKQFSVDETKTMLRQRLLEAAELAGESLTAAEVDAAISQYYENLHAFPAIEPGWRLSFAKLYVRRNQLLWKAAIVAAALVLLIWAVVRLRHTAIGGIVSPNSASTGSFVAWPL